MTFHIQLSDKFSYQNLTSHCTELKLVTFENKKNVDTLIIINPLNRFSMLKMSLQPFKECGTPPLLGF